jgi:two-component system chemotaxis sensor kinase CheA
MDYSEETIIEIFKIFQIESEEIITRLNNNLLELEKKPSNKDIILLLFRDAHTLKGASKMVGFNNVQTIAHKMEDILGLAKENKIVLSIDLINNLYKIVDFLEDLIKKSIQKGYEIYDENISLYISKMEECKENLEIQNSNDLESDFNFELFVENLEKFNTLIPEALLVLMKIEMEKNENFISELLVVVKELYDIFNITGPFDIKKGIEDLYVKLEFTSKASNSLTNNEIGSIHNILDDIINKFNSICELYNLEVQDCYSEAFKKSSNLLNSDKATFNVKELTNEEIEQNSSEDMLNVNLDILYNKITAQLSMGNPIISIKNLLSNYIEICPNIEITKILKIVLSIISFANKNEIQFDEETSQVLEQSIEYCGNIMRNNTGCESADQILVLQRLEIIQQVLEFNQEQTQEENFVIKKDAKFKEDNAQDLSEIFNAEEIKTLRVDSSKLDILINQVSELTITKIKTKKHLHELSFINKDVEDWQRNLIKTLNYLKYYDKKYLQNLNSTNNSISGLIKQLLNLFTDNNNKAQGIMSNIINLHRTIQEDDSKINLAVNNLEQMIKNIRVLPFATIFHLFGRMIRDIAQEQNKKIQLEIIGSETSADKKIIEEIKVPLIHIIRNSIDHGIETSQERIELGKNPIGKITLSAKQLNHKVLIEIKDDGRGMNLAKIKEKALSKGYLTSEEINLMTDEQIINLIFTPGFTTTDEISNISGRGIGLDIVQTKINQLNGKIKVLSEINRGCCVQIELPTSMSTLKAFVVKSCEQIFAIPTDTIKTVLRKKKEDIIFNNSKKSIIFKNNSIPLYDLADILKLNKSKFNEKEKETILIIESDDKIIALAVDKLVGDQEILHKKLSAPFYKLKNISGITTLVSGEICLILNITDIINISNVSGITTDFAGFKKIIDNKNYKILLVDDSITTRTLEKNILIRFGYNIQTAENPIEAFKQMKKTRFDLIISDLEMPEMDGFQFLKNLKTDEMYCDIPVIVVSSLISDENKNKAKKLGAEKYIVKGEFEQENFQETINQILQKK